ncbi:nuclear transport factor 2 family protein [Hoeflea sp.]|uniref:nuclear transport factor 2 family protein n=1 Tax=Hoeflea sp. TaxID=1940281 RepID=UPI0019B2F31B|nr:nuclear transport factor 2 family protein [Hoeflea sp.]MBC7285830.1 nuclear transport factor 2 family protein [Hoeflea sp.]
MSITLPAAISAYFAADRTDGDAVALCFAENAVVIDENRTHAGRDAISRWREEAAQKFSYEVDPFAVSEESKQIVVTAHLTGNFPGSPVDLRYRFTLDEGRIARLEIGI